MSRWAEWRDANRWAFKWWMETFAWYGKRMRGRSFKRGVMLLVWWLVIVAMLTVVTVATLHFTGVARGW